MGWFQRYGIPGAYFWGILIIWTLSFWDNRWVTLQADTAKILGGIIAISFTPIGYLLSVIGQIRYLSKEGIDTQARKMSERESNCCLNKESRQESLTAVQIMKLYDKKADGSKFIMDWVAKRMDIIVISCSLIYASILSFLISILFPLILKWDWDLNCCKLLLSLIITSFVILLSYLIKRILWCQLVEIESEWFKWIANKEKK